MAHLFTIHYSLLTLPFSLLYQAFESPKQFVTHAERIEHDVEMLVHLYWAEVQAQHAFKSIGVQNSV